MQGVYPEDTRVPTRTRMTKIDRTVFLCFFPGYLRVLRVPLLSTEHMFVGVVSLELGWSRRMIVVFGLPHALQLKDEVGPRFMRAKQPPGLRHPTENSLEEEFVAD